MIYIYVIYTETYIYDIYIYIYICIAKGQSTHKSHASVTKKNQHGCAYIHT
jgi:hypothetical protein